MDGLEDRSAAPGRRRLAGWMRVGTILVGALWTGSAAAQIDFSKVEITTTKIAPGVAMLMGEGGNIGVSYGDDGVFLIDDQYAPLTAKIEAAVRALEAGPIRFVLNTHWHMDHSGGNENLGAAGVLILAHHNVRERMSTEQFMAAMGRPLPPSPEVAWPVVTFEDGVTLHLNGQTIEAIHVAPAHTDGDSIVHWRPADVIHTGDTFFNGMYPFFDQSSGGRVEGMIAAADAVLARSTPGTRIIPGHGPLASPDELRRSREMLVLVRDRVRKAIEQGRSRREVVDSHPTEPFDAAFGGGFMTPDRFVGLVYDSLAAE